MVSFLVLPADLMLYIAAFGDAPTALRLTQASRELYETLIENPVLWKGFCEAAWVHLNAKAYKYCFKALYRDRNGWLPLKYINRRLYCSPQNDIVSEYSRLLLQRRTETTFKRRRLGFKRGSYYFRVTCARNRHFIRSVRRKNIQYRSKRCKHLALNTGSEQENDRTSSNESSTLSRFTDGGALPRTSSLDDASVSPWIAAPAIFDVSVWQECPNDECVMDLRTGGPLVLNVTSGWPENPAWRPQPVACLGRVHSGTVVDYADYRSEGAESSNGYAVYTTSQSDPVAYLGVRNIDMLSMAQRIPIRTTCINCIDGGPTVSRSHYPHFVLGNNDGTMMLLRTPMELDGDVTKGEPPLMPLPLKRSSFDHPVRGLQETAVNDIRLSRCGTLVMGVRTHRRYPSCVEVFDLSSEHSTFLQPSETQGRWIHAVEWGTSGSIDEVLAVGENGTTGMFGIVGMDLRVKKIIQCAYPQTRQMLWPLRVSGNDVFVNCVTPGWRNGQGTVFHFDRRRAQCPTSEGSIEYLPPEHGATRTSSRFHLGLYPCGHYRPDDIRCHHDYLYMYGTEEDQLSVQRWNYKTPDVGREPLINIVNMIPKDRLKRCLKQIYCDERGWFSSCQSMMIHGKISSSLEL